MHHKVKDPRYDSPGLLYAIFTSASWLEGREI